MLAWAIEREAIRRRKEAGEAWPWTSDPILQRGHFCNVERERDRVSKWVAENWRDPHRDDPDVWFAMAMARFINEPLTLAGLGYPVPFDPAYCHLTLKQRQERGDKTWRPEAFKPPLPKDKGGSTAQCVIDEVLRPMWRDREGLRARSPGKRWRRTALACENMNASARSWRRRSSPILNTSSRYAVQAIGGRLQHRARAACAG